MCVYVRSMKNAATLALAALWVAGNFYLWSMKQGQFALFLQSLGMAAIGYPALYWYTTRGRT